MHLCHVFSGCHESRHGAERITLEVHVKTCYYYANSLIGKVIANGHDFVVEELGFVYSDHITAIG